MLPAQQRARVRKIANTCNNNHHSSILKIIDRLTNIIIAMSSVSSLPKCIIVMTCTRADVRERLHKQIADGVTS